MIGGIPQTGRPGCHPDRPVSQQDGGGQGAAQGRQDRAQRVHRRLEQHDRRCSSALAATNGLSVSTLRECIPLVRGLGPAGGPTAQAPVLEMGRPRLRVRHLGSAQQQGTADERGRALANDDGDRRQPGGSERRALFVPPGRRERSLRRRLGSLHQRQRQPGRFRSLLSLNSGETISADQY